MIKKQGNKCYTNCMNKFTLVMAMVVLNLLVLGSSIVAWAGSLNGDLGRYDVFPLFGLLAWGLMWSHYVTGSLRRYLGFDKEEPVLRAYFGVTGALVLGMIVLHPAIFYFGLFQDGFGLPPVSSFQVYGSLAARMALLFGSLSLTVFLLFELGRWFRKRSWWRFAEYASMAAMLFIAVHALLLGGELMSGWFQLMWFGFGTVLVLAFGYNNWYDKQHMQEEAIHGSTTNNR